ncbi:MAG: hypothetical protein IJC65_08425 [Oscillospiraceae bacterium]|nr:hypothetical protein [Oscillospiraceae bacterium]
MASTAEMEKLQKTLDYFKRYFEFEDAVAVNHENREYLKTYIHNLSHTEEEFGLKRKNKIALGIAAGAGLVCGLIAMLIAGMDSFGAKNLIALGVTFVVVCIGVNFLLKTQIRKKFEQKWDAQKEINEGIGEQIDDLSRRCDTLEKQKRDYLKALEEKELACIPIKHIKYAEEIASYVKDGKAETVEDAVKMFEENVALKKITKEKERKRKQPTDSPAQRFGNPLQGLSMNAGTKSSSRRSSVRDTRKPLSMPQSRTDISDKQNEEEIGAALSKVLGASIQSSAQSSQPKSSGGLSMMSSGKKEAKKPSFVQTIVKEPVEDVAPVVEEVAPAVEEVAVAPVVEEVAPVVEEAVQKPQVLSFASMGVKASEQAVSHEVPQETVVQAVADEPAEEKKGFGLALASSKTKPGATYSGTTTTAPAKKEEPKIESSFSQGGLRMMGR